MKGNDRQMFSQYHFLDFKIYWHSFNTNPKFSLFKKKIWIVFISVKLHNEKIKKNMYCSTAINLFHLFF